MTSKEINKTKTKNLRIKKHIHDLFGLKNCIYFQCDL